MKKILLIFIASIILCCGCKSFKNLTSRDNSTPAETRSSQRNQNPQFIDGISLTPGGMVPNYSSAQSGDYKIVYAPPPILHTNINIEHVDSLQVKYAIVFDATLELLDNVKLLRELNHWWGTPYCLGGSTENCIDCSAFTQTVMQNVYRISVPRTAQQQFNSCKRIDAIDLKQGDLVFFNTQGKDISHVGIYILGNKFVHASTSSGVTVSDLNDSYWRPKFIGAGRVVK